MKLEVGMYVKYKYEKIVYIGKIMFISEVICGLDETLEIDIDNCIETILKENIIKASHNIIDLIEVGDYVNGFKVTLIYNEKLFTDEYLFDDVEGEFNRIYFKNSDIKSIVTKEMYSNVEYRVEAD